MKSIYFYFPSFFPTKTFQSIQTPMIIFSKKVSSLVFSNRSLFELFAWFSRITKLYFFCVRWIIHLVWNRPLGYVACAKVSCNGFLSWKLKGLLFQGSPGFELGLKIHRLDSFTASQILRHSFMPTNPPIHLCTNTQTLSKV